MRGGMDVCGGGERGRRGRRVGRRGRRGKGGSWGRRRGTRTPSLCSRLRVLRHVVPTGAQEGEWGWGRGAAEEGEREGGRRSWGAAGGVGTGVGEDTGVEAEERAGV